MVAANSAVNEPTRAMASMGAVSGPPSCQPAESSGNRRTMAYTPAETIVAAWIMALTGVGPSMASGSQTCSGNCALLPTVPANSSRPMTLAADRPTSTDGAEARRASISSLCRISRNDRVPASKYR